MKVNIEFRLIAIIFAFMLGGSVCHAETYTYTFTSKKFTSNGTVELDGVSWTLSGKGGDYWAYTDETKGHQFGSGSDPYTSMTLSTSDIPGTITKIILNTSGASKTEAKLQVKVGGKNFDSQASLTSNAEAYTFEDSASGTISFNYTQESPKAIYIKSITVIYTAPDTPVKKTQTLSFSQVECTVMLGTDNFAEPLLEGAMTPVTYTSSNTNAASPDATGEVSIIGAGTAIITATAAETDEYEAGKASYTIIVSEPVSNDGYVALVAEKSGAYYAMTSMVESKHMNALQVSVVNGKVVIDKNTDNSNLYWKITDKGKTSSIQDTYGKYLACGASNTELFTQSNSFTWTDLPAHSSWVSTKDQSRSFLYCSSTGYFRNYATSNIGTPSYANSYTHAMPFAEGYVRSGLTDGKYGTICLPHAVTAADMKGIELYSIIGKRINSEGNPISIIIAEEQQMEAGVPYIFKATAEEAVMAYTGEEADAPGSANGLIGVFEDTKPIPGNANYVISSNTIKKAGDNTGVRANYAYIDMNSVPVYDESTNAKRVFEIGSGDAPSSILSTQGDTDIKVDVYSITGVCLRTGVNAAMATYGLGKGIYIVGGRKVVVR